MPRVEQIQQKALEEFRERNKKSVRRKKNKTKIQIGEFVITFVCLFFLLSLVLLHITKSVMPKVDTSVGNNTEAYRDREDDKRAIDDRLKLIQFSDKMVSGELQRQQENDIFNNALEAPVIIPTHKSHDKADENNAEPPEKTLNEDVREIISRQQQPVTEETKTIQAPVPTATKVQQNVQTTNGEQYILKPNVPQSKEDLDKKIAAIQSSSVVLNAPANYKVLVGAYQTSEQAQLAKSILKDTAQGKNAFVKFVNGAYSLQVGSYSTKEQADSVARELSSNSFPARVYYEKP